MSVDFTDNTARVIADVRSKGPIALRKMLDAIQVRSNPNTPRRVGDLRKNVLKQVLGMHATIQWRQRYAAAQEDVQHRHYTAPGTGPHFAEDAVKQVVSDSKRYFREAGL